MSKQGNEEALKIKSSYKQRYNGGVSICFECGKIFGMIHPLQDTCIDCLEAEYFNSRKTVS